MRVERVIRKSGKREGTRGECYHVLNNWEKVHKRWRRVEMEDIARLVR